MIFGFWAKSSEYDVNIMEKFQKDEKNHSKCVFWPVKDTKAMKDCVKCQIYAVNLAYFRAPQGNHTSIHLPI